MLRAAKETIALAEQRLLEEDTRQFDSAWQEMLNHATQRVSTVVHGGGGGNGVLRIALVQHDCLSNLHLTPECYYSKVKGIMWMEIDASQVRKSRCHISVF